ncbi:MAG: HAMP domain-containing protein [Deltaproteobacteria bacterium]|nr:HAMP domain-containing protein [Deltaproteobacteria bacterium]
MGRLMMKYYYDMTLGFKLTVAFLAVILVPMAILSYASYKVINARLMKEARDKASMGLKAAWTEYYARGEQMRYGMLQAASMEDIKGAVARRDKTYLKKMMSTWKRMRPYVDVWYVVDGDGVVIARLNGDYSGDALPLNGLVSYALKSAEPKISTEILGREVLRLEGNELMDGIFPKPAASNWAEGAQDLRRPPDEAIALMVVTPVLSERNGPVGAIVTGDVLNNDNHLPEAVAQRFPDFFATVSLKGARVSTNLMDKSGVSLKWTAVPVEALAGVSSGGPFFLEWDSPGMSYISIFDAIRDNRGNVIGTLDASIPRESLWVIQKENQRLIIVITAVGLAIAFISALISKARITSPLRSLSGKVASFAGGDRLARAGVVPPFDTGDEVKRLAVTFNSMMDEVVRREEDGRRHLEQIEVKNRELAGLNEEMKKTNEELEVAYEETQSQTEELHAINEELRLLNEDLDRKNAELKKANTIITMEAAASSGGGPSPF